MSSAAAAGAISVVGEYAIRADAATHRPALTHTYTLQASDAIVADHQADADAAAVQPVPKAQRATANTFATKPSDLPPSCPREPVLTQLAALLRQAGQESDRYLTGLMKDEEDRKKAANPPAQANEPTQAKEQQQKKRKAKSDGGEEEGEEGAAADQQDGPAQPNETEKDAQLEKKPKVDQ